MLVKNFVGEMHVCDSGCGACSNDHYEPQGLAFMARIVKPGMNVLDIGAHVGLYSCYASTLLNRLGTIHAFEPEATAIELLKKNKILYPDITIHESATWSKNGELGINLSNPGQHWVEPDGKGIVGVALDSYFPGCIKFDFIKIDVEGAEYHTLLGMVRMLKKHRPRGIFIEVAGHHLAKFGHTVKNIADFMIDIGMESNSHPGKDIFSIPEGVIGKVHYIPMR